MEEPTLLLAQNLKRLREYHHLSLDRLAEITGVSKSMLGQIERGESSPTISTIWKISNGLKISFTSLLNPPPGEPTIIKKTDINPLIEDNGRYRLFPYFPTEDGRRFEIYTIEIEPFGSLSAEAHPAGTQEFMTVFGGKLSISTDGEVYQLDNGDSIRFRADLPHTYKNPGTELARINLVIQYND
jgi:transcriptional regulator with XRE-family HTH domain